MNIRLIYDLISYLYRKINLGYFCAKTLKKPLILLTGNLCLKFYVLLVLGQIIMSVDIYVL